MEEEISDDYRPLSEIASIPNDEALVPQLVPQQISQSSVGSSTPTWGHENHPFIIPSDISSVSIESTPVKRKKTKEISYRRSRSSTSKASTSNCPDLQQSRLLNMVHRLSIESSGSSSVPIESNNSSSSIAPISSISDDDEDDSPVVKKKFKRVNKGRDWMLYKPKYENRIYTFVLENPEDTSDVAKKWIRNYINEGHSQAIIALLQFIVDICGFPNFSLASKFKYKEENYMEVMRYLEQHPPQIHQNGNYLMRGTSEWCKQAHMGIFDFIKNIVEYAHENDILYDFILIRYIIGFPVILTKSNNRSIVHTGITFVIKIYTSLVNFNKVLASRTSHTNDGKLDVLPRLIKTLQPVIEKACIINDSSLSGVKVLFCEEVWKWFNKDPQCIQTTKFYRRLLTFVCDQSQRVRRAALSTCYKLVKTARFSEYISNYMKEFAMAVGGRLQDVDYTVAITAVNIFTSMLKTYKDDIPREIHNRILKLIYYNHYNLASASGKFTIEMIDACNESDYSSAFLIQQLIKILQGTQTENCTAVFIEALIHHCPELQQWSEIINLLLNDDLEDAEEVILVDMFCEAVHQTLTGRSRIARKKAPHGHIKTISTKNATDAILLNLHRLLIKFSDEPKSTQLMLELLLIVDIGHISMNKHGNAIVNTVNILLKKFTGTIDSKMLETISKIFVRFLDEHCAVKHSVDGYIMNLIERVCDTFLKHINILINVDEEPRTDDIIELEISSLKLSILFVDHDLTEMISYNTFSNNWSTFEDNLTPKRMTYLVKSSCWHLIWQLKVLIDNGSKAEPEDVLKQKITELKSQCNDYIQKCLLFIGNPQLLQLSEMVFECICNILLQFCNLETPIRSNQALKGLIPNFNESSQQIFLNFAHRVLFDSTFKSPLKIRRGSLVKVINIFFLGAINILQLSKIYVHYNSHHEDYGIILTTALQKLHENSAHNVVGLILLSLSYKYEKTINPATFTMNSEQCIALSKLAAQFQLYIKKFPAQLESLLKMGINYSIANEANHAFLHFLKCFAPTLSTEDKKSILDYFNENLPEGNKNHEAFIAFITYLKKKTKEKHTAKHNTSKSSISAATTATTAVSSIQISESDDINDFDTDYTIEDDSD